MKSDGISFTNTNKPLQQILLLLTGQDLFSIVTKITEPINNTIKTEISQCLFVTANMIELNNKELNCKQAMIEEIGQEEVLEIWKVVDIRSERKNHAVHKRNLYGHVWELARTATLLAVEQEDDEITLILQDYIKRKSNQNTPKRLSTIINERSTIDEVSDNP
ncbi:unnamed protein product [Rhizophagus irregularis]|nr:unnamed protein product [Rhizophagus irregularis]